MIFAVAPSRVPVPRRAEVVQCSHSTATREKGRAITHDPFPKCVLRSFAFAGRRWVDEATKARVGHLSNRSPSAFRAKFCAELTVLPRDIEEPSIQLWIANDEDRPTTCLQMRASHYLNNENLAYSKYLNERRPSYV